MGPYFIVQLNDPPNSAGRIGIFVLSMCFMGVQNQDVVEAARHSYSVPGKSVLFWDEAKNFILVPEFSVE